jgi:hypothetical protein
MKNFSIHSFLHDATKEKSRWCKTLFLSLAAMGSTVAYANVEHCLDPTEIRLDKATHQWKAAQPGWVSNTRPRNITDTGNFTLKSVKLTIDHKKGDVIECAYAADNGEKVVFTKGGSSSDSAIVSEIIPIDEKAWNNPAVKNEFICTPSATDTCGFKVVALPGNANAATSDDEPLEARQAVQLHFDAGTAFVAYACAKTDAPEPKCFGPFYVNGTYYLPADASKFCVEINEFAGMRWGRYYFDVSTDYAGDAMRWWGVSLDPKYEAPNGITFLKYQTSNLYTSCDLLTWNGN